MRVFGKKSGKNKGPYTLSFVLMRGRKRLRFWKDCLCGEETFGGSFPNFR